MAGEWKKVQLQNIVSKLGDGIHGTPEYSETGRYFFINGNNLDNGRILLKNDTKRVSFSEYTKYKKILNNRTLLVSINGTIGNIACYNNEPVILGKSACYFNLHEDVDRRFIRYVLSSSAFLHYLESYSTGTTIKNVSIKMMREFSFWLPPLNEQRCIAHILGSLDDKIEMNRRMNATLEGMAQALFKSWFIDFDPVIDNILVKKMAKYSDQNQSSPPAPLPKGEGCNVRPNPMGEDSIYDGIPEEFMDRAEIRRQALADGTANREAAKPFPAAFQLTETMGWIPDGWRASTLGSVASNIRDSVNPQKLSSNTPYVGLEHIGRKEMYLSDWGSAGDVDSNKATFHAGDVLFGKLRPYFHKVCIVNFEGVCSTDILVFRAKENCWSGFVQYQLFDEKLVEYANARSTGTRMPRANWQDLMAYPIAKPSKDLAACFTELVAGFNTKATLNLHSANELSKLRDTLLPKLISGELRIKDAKYMSKAGA